MTKNSEWRTFFDAHAPKYMEEPFVRHTEEEVDFLIEELELEPGMRILDIGCGTGRHVIEFSRRGFRVTGLDISAGMLKIAEEAAEQDGLDIELITADAERFSMENPYDAAVCLCEGAFCLLGSADDPFEHDRAILDKINDSLKPGAPLALEALNAFRKIRNFTNDDVKNGRFDPNTMTDKFDMETESPDGEVKIEGRERSYTPSELTLLLNIAGFEVLNIWGGTAGHWGKRPVDLDEIAMLAIARSVRK